MKWGKHGLVWAPDGSMEWAASHATCPTPILLEGAGLRVYVQCRDSNNVGRIGYVDLDPADPRKVLATAPRPVLDVGAPGMFDDNGVMPTSVLRAADGRIFMYYVGFELSHHIRYRLLTGLAISTDEGETFHRYSTVPVLERSSAEPHFRCGPYVLRSEVGFSMWYVAGGSWEDIDGKSMPIYDVRFMESKDGMTWPQAGRVVLPINEHEEHGFGRPFVKRRDSAYVMHYSIRKRNPARYLLGYAESMDGLAWTRKDDQLGILPSAAAWEDHSLAYGAEFSHAGRTWLLYNGNDFGRDGFGVAELLEP